MLSDYLNMLKCEFSKERAFDHVVNISQFHRIQASPGHRDAAKYCESIFKKNNVKVEILKYKGDGKTKYWEYPMPQEWYAKKGILEIVDDENTVIANFENEPISLIQRSISTPKDGVINELVILDNGDDEESYVDVNFNNKIVLTSGNFDNVREWAVKKGAVGVITDRIVELPPVRHRYDMGDALTYSSFWWYGNEDKCFGFVISPKTGDLLRRLSKKNTVRLKSTVESYFYDGEIEVVSGYIPGETSEEVVLIAHLCHPKPSANDNASGCGVVLETARAINHLLISENIKGLKRGIRFLLLPEMSGTYAFLANNESLIPNMVAALNLDMVGQNQCLCHSPLVTVLPPHSTGHFAGDLIQEVLNFVTKEVSDFAGQSKYALFMHTVTPFVGGSDHYIFSDPTVGVGAPMLIQWPDKYYHTSQDTIDKVDSNMLKRVGLMAGLYSLFVANADSNSTQYLAEIMQQNFAKELSELLRLKVNSVYKTVDSNKVVNNSLCDTLNKIDYLHSVKMSQLKSLLKLDKSLNLHEFEISLSNITESYKLMVKRLFSSKGIKEEVLQIKDDKYYVKAKTMTITRLSRGPISLRFRFNSLKLTTINRYKALSKKFGKDMGKLDYLLYWCDGNRNLQEVIDLVGFETGQFSAEVAIFFAEMLQELELIKVL